MGHKYIYISISVLFEQYFFFGGGRGGCVWIAQLVEVTDSAGLGGAAEVVSSNPTVGHKMFLSIFQHS